MDHPCNKECKDRCVGCKSLCLKLLEYNVMFKRTQNKANNWSASDSAKMCSDRARMNSMSKRKATTKEWLTGQNISYSEYMRSDVVVNCL